MVSFHSPSTILCVLLCLAFVLTISEAHTPNRGRDHLLSYRRGLKRSMEEKDEDNPILQSPPKKQLSATTTQLDSNKNKTNILKPKKTNSTTTTTSSTNATTKLLKSSKPAKLLKPSNSTNLLKPTTSTEILKPSNSTKLLKAIKPTKFNSNTTTTPLKPKHTDPSLPKNRTQPRSPPTAKSPPQQKKPQKSLPKQVPHMPWLDDPDEDSDLISEFRNLPTKFQEALLPDLHRIHTTSKAYLTRANKEFARTFKPLVGTKYAPTAALAASGAFLLLPLLLVALLLHHLRRVYHYLPLQKILLSIQIYLFVYFAILSLTAAATGMEPLRFFHRTSPESYVYTQVLQMLGYVLYLLLQLMNMVVVGGGGGGGVGAGARARAVAVAQVAVAMAVGLHYYTAVFHRAVLGEPPRTNWKVHGVYAVCFAVVSVLAGAERGKKAYLQTGGVGGGDCKKS